jgi:hypothetical protein
MGDFSVVFMGDFWPPFYRSRSRRFSKTGVKNPAIWGGLFEESEKSDRNSSAQRRALRILRFGHLRSGCDFERPITHHFWPWFGLLFASRWPG